MVWQIMGNSIPVKLLSNSYEHDIYNRTSTHTTASCMNLIVCMQVSTTHVHISVFEHV